MNFTFTSKNTRLPDQFKDLVKTQLKEIEKFCGQVIEGQLIVNEQKAEYKIEISIKTNLNSFYAEDRDKVLKTALRKVLANLKTQAKKIKEKVKDDKTRVKKTQLKTKEENPPKKARVGSRPKLINSDNFSKKPITVEEAIFFLNESKENGYVFINVETNRIASIFKNDDGSISYVEPEF